MSRQNAYQACWEFVHSLSAEQAMADQDPLIQTLAIVDNRLGRRRFQRIEKDLLHPLEQKMQVERAKVQFNIVT